MIEVVAIRAFGMRIWLGNASNVPETNAEEVPTKIPQPTMYFVGAPAAVDPIPPLSLARWHTSAGHVPIRSVSAIQSISFSSFGDAVPPLSRNLLRYFNNGCGASW